MQSWPSSAERQILEAVVEVFLPSSDGPGAREAASADYVAKALAQSEDAVRLSAISAFLTDLDQSAATQFYALPMKERDEIIRNHIKNGNNRYGDVAVLLLTLAIEGFLCHPKQGGNRDGAGWSYIGCGIA